jgi:protein-tyrosine-phosphatase/DNA-binding transcriptional ArsR family regulator
VHAAPSPGSAAPPPAVLRLAGHPVRWRLLRELARSDRHVRELTALTGGRQSLTSYHLGRLRAGGLVTSRRSAADGRDVYYGLALSAYRDRLAEAGAALHPGMRLVPPELTPPAVGAGDRRGGRVEVLFLCTGNSARSQMAEAIAEHLGGPRVAAASAGTHPRPLHPGAVRAMRDRGIDIAGRRAKHLDEFAGRRFDHVISLCDRVREVCPEFPGGPAGSHWSIPDPAAGASAGDDTDVAFARTADELDARIRFLLMAIEHSPAGADGRWW